MEEEEFKSSELKINYISYELDGYPERYGKPISNIEYKGQDVYVEFEDNGSNVEYLMGYEFDGDDFTDQIVVFENLFTSDNDPLNMTEFVSKIFGSKKTSKIKREEKKFRDRIH